MITPMVRGQHAAPCMLVRQPLPHNSGYISRTYHRERYATCGYQKPHKHLYSMAALRQMGLLSKTITPSIRKFGHYITLTLPSNGELSSPMVAKYKELVKEGVLIENEAQSLYLSKLSELERTLREYMKEDRFNKRFVEAKREPERIARETNNVPSNTGLLKSIKKNVSGAFVSTSFDMKIPDVELKEDTQSQIRQFEIHPLVKPLYLYGGVGGGKTRLTNLFYDSMDLEEMPLCEVFKVNEPNQYKKMRNHFHEFMLRVQYLIHSRRSADQDMIDLDIPEWLNGLALYEIAYRIRNAGVILVYLDEFQVTNISDALILKPLFEALIHFGVSVVVTSNRPPSELYYHGLNRDQFLPFIGFVQKEWRVVHLDTERDFRSVQMDINETNRKPVSPFIKRVLKELGKTWISDGNTNAEIEKLVLSCSPDRPLRTAVKLPLIGGRFFLVPFSISSIAICSYKDLFESNIGSADYLGLSGYYELLYIHGIPCMKDMSQSPNAIRRFITFVDICYENELRCVFDSSCKLLDLFPHTDGIQAMNHLVKCLLARRSSKLNILRLIDPIMEKGRVQFSKCRRPRSTTTIEHRRQLQTLYKMIPLSSQLELAEYIKFHLDNIDFKTTKKIEWSPEIAAKPYAVTFQLRNEIEEHDNEFAYIRTLSRLLEMTNSELY